ncbi:archaetidylinositol phosphate synthase [Acidianus sp. RZ1]|uniref:archaetidylinositol phosphate synthase n=1 Tax=Acidianus sp. RZ1 TaxID=1540082 RepID=UPI001490C24D|nr:archaetidylinositol phosphate synthase [Acidianus sp. RZ1]NON61873.1 CDP-alcohol phosphatidyltransferase family protein [Acidianus sp. RZ1]
MITRLRKESKRILTPLALGLAKFGLSGNALTTVGLLLSIAYFVLFYFTRDILIALILMILSSLSDALDGEVARITHKAGSRGAFLDSSFDRLEDALFISPLSLYFSPILVALLVGISLTIPYLRAKAESLGIRAEGRGIIERGERLIFVVILLLMLIIIPYLAQYIFYIFIILSIVTVIQRFQLVLSALPK